jgi:signal transduction histidine kinase
MVGIDDVTQQRVADEARNAFITQVTHELRAPLTNIRLYTEQAIEDGEQDPEMRGRCLNVISEEARRLEGIVTDMLSVAEIEAGTMNLRKDDVRLEMLIESLKADYSGLAGEKNITLEFKLPPKLPVIHADRDKIGLALHNLVNNALKYTPDGGRVEVKVDVKDGNMIIEVVDSGIGIAEADIGQIFERFYRANDPKVSAVTGSGLGLALAREVVRLHGGDIQVESEVGKGSTFSIVLPALSAKAA